MLGKGGADRFPPVLFGHLHLPACGQVPQEMSENAHDGETSFVLAIVTGGVHQLFEAVGIDEPGKEWVEGAVGLVDAICEQLVGRALQEEEPVAARLFETTMPGLGLVLVEAECGFGGVSVKLDVEQGWANVRELAKQLIDAGVGPSVEDASSGGFEIFGCEGLEEGSRQVGVSSWL
jgi:hypothetical protein